MRHASFLSFITGCVFTLAALTRCVVPAAKADGPDAGAASSARVKSNVLKTADGTTIPTGVLHDTKLDVDCSFRRAADGQLRCLPTGFGVGLANFEVFADSECSAGIAGISFLDADGCLTQGVAPKYAVGGSDQTCNDARKGFAVYAVGQPLTDVYTKDGARPPHCTSQHISDSGTFVLGDEVNPETFALATPAVE